ncbi:MAG: ABC transporter ATP-binding protein [Armatimonadota bacterium]|nr:ABC transporter ATP-binding protein [Armatimonadota bacterium]
MTKRFDKTVAVDNLSLEVREGELFFMLGPSGCGKTTCLRMVAGFATPDAGVLRFGERVMNNVPPHRRNTGMVFQNYALWPHLTARGNVEYGLRVRKVPRAERDKMVDQALEMVRLGGLGDRYPGQLSGGQQQRVALARALVIRPDVLLLDEPLSNLDAQLRLEMRREIKRLHGETGTTALYVTHDQEEALSIADRIAILKDGLLQQVGTPRELYHWPHSRFVAEFIGETNFLPGRLRNVEVKMLAVETPVGELQAARPDFGAWQVGQEVWCSIRPESWRVSHGDQSDGQAENQVAARLESVMYLGQVEQYQVRLTGGRETLAADSHADETWRAVKVSVMNPGVDAPQAGDALRLSCDPEDVVVLID